MNNALSIRSVRKNLGSFYTPQEVCDFLAAWAIRDPDDSALEPAAGDGAIVEAVRRRQLHLSRDSRPAQLLAVELVAREAEKIERRAPGVDVHVGPFLDLIPRDFPQFTAVVGNPPFIRFQLLPRESRSLGVQRAADSGVELSALASSWAHFLLHASSFLDPVIGRLAMVLPAELLYSDYGLSIREFLARRFASITTIVFETPMFPDLQVDALLLLADQAGPSGRHWLRLSDTRALSALEHAKPTAGPYEGRWRVGFGAGIARDYADLLSSGSAFRLADIGSVDIGVVTGADRFFVLSAEDAHALGLPAGALRPIVRRPRDLLGLSLRETEVAQLLALKGAGEAAKDPSVAKYLATVEPAILERHKLKVRKQWYEVPLPRADPHLLLPYMNHDAPRLVANPLRARATNLIHSVTLKDDTPDLRVLAAASLSSVTALSGEIEGRVYGGGVLKLEPADAERLLLPQHRGKEDAILAAFDDLDNLVRSGRTTEARARVDEILEIDAERLRGHRDDLVQTRRLLHRRPSVRPA